MKKNVVIILQIICCILQAAALIFVFYAWLAQDSFKEQFNVPSYAADAVVLPLSQLIHAALFLALMALTTLILIKSKPTHKKKKAVGLLIAFIVIYIGTNWLNTRINAANESLGDTYAMTYYWIYMMLSSRLSVMDSISYVLYIFSLGIYFEMPDTAHILEKKETPERSGSRS
ncbi:MAG: hypothetical protein ACOX1W_03035 [Catenisphaera adipataccumulans]|uniref:hypothetical protein n=1 Tax=Catenisphaera adipataccumulans TaxID=700500 RepID=UPI003D94EB8C